MSKEESLLIKNGLNTLAKFQEDLDAVTWQINKPEMAKLRHISWHIAKINGALAEICHNWEHKIVEDAAAVNDLTNLNSEAIRKIIADLLMYAAQMSNLINVSPYSVLSDRVTSNIQRFAPDAELSLDP